MELVSEALETSSLDSDFFLLNKEKAGTERGRLLESFFALMIGFQILSSSIGIGVGDEGLGGDLEVADDDGGSDMLSERSSRCSIMLMIYSSGIFCCSNNFTLISSTSSIFYPKEINSSLNIIHIQYDIFCCHGMLR